jgi:T3SS negative regulator,GrlR
MAMPGIRNGLYTVETDMTDGGRGHATRVIVLINGRIAGGDAHFYYTGSYTAADGKWRGELTTLQHAKPAGVLPLFGGREVTCGFTGTYSDDGAVVTGTALVGKTSVLFATRLKFREAL